MTLEQYLTTRFEGSDCEYVDGEILERNWGDALHAEAHGALAFLLATEAEPLRLQAFMSIRVLIRPDRYRVADLAVWPAGYIGGRIPLVPPFLAVEILSPEDRILPMHSKLADYFSIGVKWIWLLDPREGTALCFSPEHPAGFLSSVLRTENPKIEIAVDQVLRPLA